MNIMLSPQRSFNTRTNFYFDLENRRLLVFYKKGKEKTVREGDDYVSKFIESQEEKYIIRLDFIEEDAKHTPISFIIKYLIKPELDDSAITLLKQYGPEEENDLRVTYPDWNSISDNTEEYKINKKTSLNDFEKLVHTWRNQLSEILTQTYNICLYLNNEYLIINNDTPPFGSPISIRSFKTSILSNTILYIENVANFYTSLAIEINQSCNGAPKNKCTLTEKEVDELSEKTKSLSLDKKLKNSISKINKLTDSNLNLEKDKHWNNFIEIKQKRNALTHAKIEDHNKHINVSINHMISSVKITDLELMKCIETIIWLNKFTDILFDKISIKKGFHNFSFNNHDVFLLLKLISKINEVPYNQALERNGLNDPFPF